MTQLSVIIPVRNAAPFIRRCALSLFCQTMTDDIEYIFVNDSSTDGSMEELHKALMEYPDRIKQTRIIHHETPQGISAARNRGLELALGEYVAFCDADDWLEDDIYDNMLAAARRDDADMVVCDYVEEYWGRKHVCRQKPAKTPQKYLLRLYAGMNDGVIWNRIIRRSVITDNNITFPVGINVWEDVITTMAIARVCERITFISGVLYHYNQENPDSVSMKMDDARVLDMERALEYMKQMAEDDESGLFRKYLPFREISAQLFVMHKGSERQAKAWSRKFAESAPYIKHHPALSTYWKTALRLNHRFGYAWFSSFSSLAQWFRK